MGKPTGFIEYERHECPASSPLDRLTGYSEFHQQLSASERIRQGGRCMNCGVPFCQSEYGCPLHNLIPEWNDEVFADNMAHALSRLLKTNNFPEFTGRVCPALCENACVCGLNGDPVTVRDNELSIIENAWDKGFLAPTPPSVRTGKRVAVVGSGPAGLTVADQLNRRGHSVTVYERDDRPGGLLMYGIPNMKLDKRVVLRRINKMSAEGIEFICNTEIGTDISGSQLMEQYDAVVLCCGARRPRPLGLSDCEVPGILPALDYLTAATKALMDEAENRLTAKGRHVIVVGNGDTATDCVATALRQGAVSITQLVRRPKPVNTGHLWPYRPAGLKMDYGQEEAAAVSGHDPRLFETTVQELLTDENGSLRAVRVKTAGEDKELPAGLLLLATGFSGAEVFVAETFGLKLNEHGQLGNENYRTMKPKVFACGDLRRGASLVVWAIAEGRACARIVDKSLEGYSNL